MPRAIIKPSSGGNLLSGLSKEQAGLANYTQKQDFRRHLDREIRSEGYDRFNPAAQSEPPMPETGGEPITLVTHVRNPNGHTATVVGTKTTLYRYYGLDDPNYSYDPYSLGDGYRSSGTFGDNGEYVPGPFVARGVSDVDPLCVDANYFMDEPGQWAVIGSGFSENGKRWEAKNINGYLILNNGVDIPVTYRDRESRVKPIYELRDNGIASVGTIGEHNGILVCMDIRQLKQDFEPYNAAVNGSVASQTVSPSIETLFPNLDWAKTAGDVVGLYLLFGSGEAMKITGVSTVGPSEHYFEVAEDVTIASTSVRLENPDTYSTVEDPNLIEKYHWRMLWGLPDEPRRFGATVTGKITPTSNVVRLDRPSESFAVGQSVKIVNTDLTGGITNITGTIIFATPTEIWIGGAAITNAGEALAKNVSDAKVALAKAEVSLASANSALAAANVVLDQAAEALSASPEDEELKRAKADAESEVNRLSNVVIAATTAVTAAEDALADAEKLIEPLSVSIQAADAAASIAAYEDLIDDGSAILRGLTLRNFFIIYKETSIFIARYTGDTGQAFVLEKVPIPDAATLGFKHTLVDVGGMFHFYAGANGFYRFDMTNRIPMEIPELMGCKEVFFRQASKSSEPFSADNSITKEVFVCLPEPSESVAMLRYDYLYNTVSTSTMAITAAALVYKPSDPSNTSKTEAWFTMGNSNGIVLRYGFVDGPEHSSGAITATVAAGVATASASFFKPEHVGRSIRFYDDVLYAITGYTSPTEVSVLMPVSGHAAGQFRVVNVIYHRDGQAYSSVLESGLDAFGGPSSEKLWNEYVAQLSSMNPTASLAIDFRGARNPYEEAAALSTTISDAQSSNLVPLMMQANYIGDRITVNGVNNPVEIVERQFNVEGVNAKNFTRHP